MRIRTKRTGPVCLNSQAMFDKWIACGFKLPSPRQRLALGGSA